MRVVTKYISGDGREFLDYVECQRYEDLCAEVARIMSRLHSKPDLPSCGFENGAGYVKHDPAIAGEVRIELLKIANKLMPHHWFEQAIASNDIHPSYPSRLIGEMSERCLSRAWHRFACMTHDFREFGQPYFASNPGSAKDVCLNEAST